MARPAKGIAPADPEPDLDVAYVPLSEIVSPDINPKQHDIDAIIAGFSKFGVVQPAIRNDRTGKFVAGEGRKEALIEMRTRGLPPPPGIVVGEDDWLMPVLTGVSFDTDEAALSYLIADNSLTTAGGWNDALLFPALVDIGRRDLDLVHASGFLDYLPGLQPLSGAKPTGRALTRTYTMLVDEHYLSQVLAALRGLAARHPEWNMTVEAKL